MTPAAPSAPAASTPVLHVVHEDESLIVLDKPAGVLAVPGRGALAAADLWTLACTRWPDARVVHRLDQATSGLIVFARGDDAQRRLSHAFADRQVDKHYVALVQGRVALAQGRIALALAADWPRRPRQQVDPGGKPARTEWQRLAHEGEQTRLALQPLTGRTHQLRVHLSAIGHPIVGDLLYDGPPAPRLMLHACALALPHPHAGTVLRLSSAAPF